MIPSDLDRMVFIVSEITFLFKNTKEKTYRNSRVSVLDTYFEITSLNKPTKVEAIIYNEDIASLTYTNKY